MIRIPAIISALALAGFFAAGSACARPSSSITATASATVMEGLSITGEQPLDFGFIIPSPHGGTVTVSFDNRRSATGGVRMKSRFSRAVFAVRGIPGHNYTIHAPYSFTFSAIEQRNQDAHKSPANELTVNDFVTYSVNLESEGNAGRLGRNGQDRVYLGATLIVPANALPGFYSGWVPVTVSY